MGTERNDSAAEHCNNHPDSHNTNGIRNKCKVAAFFAFSVKDNGADVAIERKPHNISQDVGDK